MWHTILSSPSPYVCYVCVTWIVLWVYCVVYAHVGDTGKMTRWFSKSAFSLNIFPFSLDFSFIQEIQKKSKFNISRRLTITQPGSLTFAFVRPELSGSSYPCPLKVCHPASTVSAYFHYAHIEQYYLTVPGISPPFLLFSSSSLVSFIEDIQEENLNFLFPRNPALSQVCHQASNISAWFHCDHI